jgi:hypothetical protein
VLDGIGPGNTLATRGALKVFGWIAFSDSVHRIRLLVDWARHRQGEAGVLGFQTEVDHLLELVSGRAFFPWGSDGLVVGVEYLIGM